MTTPAQYFKTFFEETDKAPNALFEIENGYDMHIICSDDIVEMLTNLPNDEGARTLRDQLTRLDFANQPILPWLRHLATGYIRTNFPTTL